VGEVHEVGAQIRERAYSPGLLAKAPGHRSCGVEEPVLQLDARHSHGLDNLPGALQLQ
jgi:hypothetical protein